eukprot:164249-Chlamydomonas_euryale.AAC.1
MKSHSTRAPGVAGSQAKLCTSNQHQVVHGADAPSASVLMVLKRMSAVKTCTWVLVLQPML